MVFGNAPADIPKGEANRWTLVSVALLFLIFAVTSLYIPEALDTLIGNAAGLISQNI